MSQLTRLPQVDAERVQWKLTNELLSSPTEFSLESLRRRGWVAAPVRDGISDEEATRISAAATELGESKAVCVTTEPRMILEAWEVELSEEGLHRFHYNCMLRVFLLAPESLSFALLDEADYFYILAGPRAFVEAAVGRCLAEALNAFSRYAETVTAHGKTREWLRETATRYRLEDVGPP